jgi:hypothetical protein
MEVQERHIGGGIVELEVRHEFGFYSRPIHFPNLHRAAV